MSSRPIPTEFAQVAAWMQQHFTPGATLPFSFRYGGQTLNTLVADWQAEWTPRMLTLTDPATGLQLRCEMIRFDDFPAMEWVLSLKNTGSTDTPILADIRPLDLRVEVAESQDCRVHHARGSECRRDDFAPLETPLDAGGTVHLASLLGRSSNGTLPFFNLQLGETGLIGAIGWTGGWVVDFTRDAEGIRVSAGMAHTHLTLHPGEEIRTPRILWLCWDGERLHGHNMLRQLILAHYTPRPNGELLRAPMNYAVWGENTAPQQIAKARWLVEHDIPMDNFWIDAGWHGDGAFREDSTVFNSDWAKHVGNWWPNATTYPDGLHPVGDALREMGLGFVLWLEPERVFTGTYFTREHPEWLHGPIGDNYLFDLGNPEARQALTQLVGDVIETGGVTCYRQDFNTDPAPFWEAADAPDRVGMSEIRHIQGLYAFWDALLARFPGLVIDNCSSGGRRIDLEMLRRSIALWRSDYQCYPGFDPTGMQGQTHGLSLWAPLHTGCYDTGGTYHFRSALGPGIVVTSQIYARDPVADFPVEWLHKMMVEQRHVRKYFYGDFYPLLSFSLSNEVWAAWQFHRPDLGEGMVLALRRQDSPFSRIDITLRDLDPAASYIVEEVDTRTGSVADGAYYMTKGLSIEINEQPGSVLYIYKSR